VRRVLVVLTGGTIAGAMRDGKDTAPDTGASERLERLLEEFFDDRGLQVATAVPWGVPGLDSSDLNPQHWIRLTRIIIEELQKGDLQGIIVLHGTDTMAFTAAWLSLVLEGIPLPVVLTGSQLTLDYTPEDVQVNLRGAAQVVCAGYPGVWVYFNWKLIPGKRAHKARAIHPDAFTAVNGLPVFFSPEWGREAPKILLPELHWRPPQHLQNLLRKKETAETISTLARQLRWYLCMPGCAPHFTGEEKALVLLGFGAGNAPSEILQALVSRFENEPMKPMVIACSQAEGDTKNPQAYKGVGIASLAKKGFFVWGQGDASLEFVHALLWYAFLAAPDSPASILGHYLKGYAPGNP
jgi:L-asparaginase